MKTTEDMPISEMLDFFEHNAVDEIEACILGNMDTVELPLKHNFAEGLYWREIFMPTGSLVVSKIHAIRHPYVILKGKANVFIPGEGIEYLGAGYSGCTEAGTRRVLYIEEDCTWITYHSLSPEEEEARKDGINADDLVAMVESRIFEQRAIPGTGGTMMYDLYRVSLKEQKLLEEVS